MKIQLVTVNGGNPFFVSQVSCCNGRVNLNKRHLMQYCPDCMKSYDMLDGHQLTNEEWCRRALWKTKDREEYLKENANFFFVGPHALIRQKKSQAHR